MIALSSFVKQLKEAGTSKSLAATSNESDKPARKFRRIKDWQLILPKEGEPRTKVVDGVTYHVCMKQYKNGKGVWVTHEEEDHDETRFNKRKNQKNNNNKANDQKSTLIPDASLTALFSAFQYFE